MPGGADVETLPSLLLERRTVLLTIVIALRLVVPTDARAQAPDLGIVRYRDPAGPRELWLGLDVGGVYLPEKLAPIDTAASTLRLNAAWALALTPRLTAGGRHGAVYYEAKGTLLEVYEHLLELSFRTLPLHHPDRLSLTVEFHRLNRNWVEGEEFAIGGVSDAVVGLGYGIDHPLSPWLRLGWNLQARWVDVFLSTQRQLRASLRPALAINDCHRLSLELLGFLVHRDADQFGRDIDELSTHGQLQLAHDWMSPWGIGTFTALKYSTSFLSGEAPMFEVRREALETQYGEALVGVRGEW